MPRAARHGPSGHGTGLSSVQRNPAAWLLAPAVAKADVCSRLVSALAEKTRASACVRRQLLHSSLVLVLSAASFPSESADFSPRAHAIASTQAERRVKGR